MADTPEQIRQKTREHLDTLTPGRAEETASVIAEQWERDWGEITRLLAKKTGLSQVEAFQFLMLREIAMMRTYFVERNHADYHPDCAECRRQKEFQTLQQEALELTIRHLKDEHGDEWKDDG